ncbi:S28 family serine protease [Streptomyces sp. NPDC033538]|uniref:S28 family serine protease n=1 Tax=Streptomyces sp. NPDC033538 TaxID=3155367 RepID=UPI00340E12DA
MRVWRRRLLKATAMGVLSLALVPVAPGTTTARAAAVTVAGDGGGRWQGDVLDALRALPGLRVVEERPGAEAGYRFFVLGLRQPVDHTDPSAGTFEQRLTLLHKSTDRPTVLFTTGYEVPLSPRRAEPTVLLDGNQIGVEHRFFGTSRPATVDWSHLTVRQAAEDHHRVVRLFRGLYRGTWISTGGSKGGMASVYHRRFHPDDVDGTIAYSAPNNVDDRDDSAYLRFLDTVGTASCRDALKTVQRQALLRREELVTRYEAWAASTGRTFRIVGSADKALETAVLRAPLMFWQNRGASACPGVPAPDATSEELYRWLDATALLSAYTDPVVEQHVPYFYQLGTQLGYYDVQTAHLAGLLRYPDAVEPRNFVPRDIPMRFDRRAMPDIDRWVRGHGSRLLFVNGDQDPAVAEHFRIGPGTRDSRVHWAPGASHSAGLEDLPPAARAEATATLRRWADDPADAAD